MPVTKKLFNVMIGKQSAIDVAGSITHGLDASDSINDKVDIVKLPNCRGTLEENSGQEVMKERCEGSIKGCVFDRTFAKVAHAIMGSSTPTTLATGVYKQSLAYLQNAVRPFYTIECKRGDIEQQKYLNCVFESLKIEAKADDYVRFETNVKGKAGVVGNSVPSYVEENPFTGKNIRVKIANQASDLDTASVKDVSVVSLEINQSLKEILNCGKSVKYVVEKQSISGSLELTFESTEDKALWLANNKNALRIEMVNTAVDLGGGNNPKVTIDSYNVHFTEFSLGGGEEEIVNVTLSFESYYSDDDAKSISMEVVCKEATL